MMFLHIEKVQIIKCLMYLIFLITTYFFARELIEEYLEGKTNFSATKQPLRIEDMPTLTICLTGVIQLDYGTDVWISTFTQYTKNITSKLTIGKNDIHGHIIHLRKLALSTKWYSDCFTLDFEFTEEFYQQTIHNTSVYDRIFHFDLYKINLSNSAKGHISKIELLIASKSNSFGAVIFQWFDGLVDPIPLKRHTFHDIAITKTKKYHYIPGTCSKHSFFECVALKLDVLNTCRMNGIICSPFTLPDTPICPTNSTQCLQEVMEQAFPQCMAKKSCKVQEYYTRNLDELDLEIENEMLDVEQRIRRMGGTDEVVQQMFSKQRQSIILSLSFDALDWSKGDRNKELQVEVFTEYYVSNTFSMIVSVGGQMGLFIGFSFIGCFVWFMKWVQGAWSVMNKN